MSELRIERIDVLSNDRLVISAATLLDAKGRPVLALKGLSARLDAWTILKNLFEPAARVELPEVHIAQFELGLYRSESGGVTLTEAFDTRPDPSKPKTATPTVGKGPRVLLPRVAIDRVSARTDLSGLSQATADLHTLTLNFDWSPELFALGVASDDARVTRALPLDARARLNAQLRIPGATDVTLDGKLGALPIQASFRAASGELTLNLSSPALEPEAMRSLIPSWPLIVPVNARVEVVGRPSAMHAKVQALAGASRLDAEGPVTLSPNLKADLSLTASALDARLLAPDVAQTALNAEAKLELAFDSAIHVALNAHLAKGDLFGAALPETNFVAVYAEQRVTGTLSSADPAFPVGVDFHLSSEGSLGFHARAQGFDLAALAAYGVRAQGQSDLDASGELSRGQLTAEFEARLRGLRIAPVIAPAALVRGKVRGAIAHPAQLAVELEAQGTKLALGTVEFPTWSIESKGTVERQTVALRAGPESAPTLQGSTTLAFGSGVALSETRLEAELHGVKHAVELTSARVASSLVEFGGLHWQVGAGTLAGAGSLSPTRKFADLELSGVDLRELLKTLGMAPDAVGGRVSATVHFKESGRLRRGQLKASLVGGAMPEIGAMDAAFDVAIVDSDVEGRGELSAPKLGLGKLALRGSLGHGPLSSLSLARLVGELGLELSDVQLDEVSRRWLPSAGLALSGRADASVRLVRKEPSGAANVSYEVKTRELGLRSQHSDGEGTLRYGELSSRGQIGEHESNLQFELKDAAGPWITAKVEHSLGLGELVRGFRSASPIALVDAPLRAEISAQPRSLELLGGAVPRAFSGEVSAQLGITGNLRRPEIVASLNATGLGGNGRDASGKLALNFDYSAAREEYTLTAQYANRARAKLEFSGAGHWSWIDHGFGRDWSAQGQAKIEKLELGPIAQLLGVSLTGQAAGQVALSASSSEFEATGKIDLRSLALEHQSLGDGSVQMRVHQGLAEAQLSMASGDSTLEFAGELGVCWDDGPCVDAKRGGSLDAKVRKFQLAAVAPLLRSVASDIRGPVNGFMTLTWEPADATGKRNTHLRADAVVTDGSVTLTLGAGSIQCLALRARGDEERTLNLELSGCARVNKPNLEAKVRVLWNGPAPQRVEAELGPLKEVPVTFDGVMLGKATVTKGQPIRLLLELAETKRAVEVNVPNLEFALPKKDDTSLVDLEDDPAIVVTDAKAPPAHDAQSSASSPWSVAIKLGKAVKVTQSGMKVPVTGALSQGPDGLLDGNIILPEGGVVPQLGQIFRLKRGSVRFNQQPLKDGALSIEASTRTTDGVVIDLFVSGTIEKPLIRLRSDPPRSENDILALLLGVQGSDTVSTNGKQGADLRGSATALAMNQLLRGSALASLQFGAGQNHQGDSVSTVSMRAPGMDTVWLEGRTVRNSTQRAANSTVQASGVIDWRFARGFSLRTQLGNNVSGVELRWSHRY
ncbi:MAG TPA: translocation/assembly module TamB domain-containing protein [Polyangiaceae bacterium]|nr:translocation/assembly module TamB domain-containing protein [Polyangiaceae bacterium]